MTKKSLLLLSLWALEMFFHLCAISSRIFISYSSLDLKVAIILVVGNFSFGVS